MIKILFLCHGSICRSPMAEFIFKNKIKEYGISDYFIVDSKALSNEEIGNDMDIRAKKILDKYHINYNKHCAKKFSIDDYLYYDYIYYMDNENYHYLNYIIKDDKHKCYNLASYLNEDEIDDPWYSGDFEKTYVSLLNAINNLIIDKFNNLKGDRCEKNHFI